AISSDDISVREMNNAIEAAERCGLPSGFKYVSYTGVHPLGSKGTSDLESPILVSGSDPTPSGYQRIIFKPRKGMENQNDWTSLPFQPASDKKPAVRLVARVPLGGEFPLERFDDKKLLFKFKLLSGNDDQLNIKLTTPEGRSETAVLQRGKSF